MKKIDDENRVIREELPLEGARAFIAQRMTESMNVYPQGSAFMKVDMTNLLALKQALKEEGKKITFGDFFVKAVACALEENMSLNGSRKDGKLFYYDSINIGMMASINGYLMEPVICDVDCKDVEAVSAELADMYANLRKGKLMRVNTMGATFSVTNLGTYDCDGFTPLLSPPEGGIIGIGRTVKEVVVDENDNMVIRPMSTLSITTDHGLVDGVAVMEFMRSLKKIVEHPKAYMYHTKEKNVVKNVVD